ncbi:MAG: hypothetical protein HQ518_09720, partial [Rhodopirellula sp.]|nr:hypothetical protein [Rhodopirellula sp.]
AEKMMASFPDDAAPVIDAVLSDLDRQVDALRHAAAEELADRKRENLLKRAAAMAQTASKLAMLLMATPCR